MRIKINATGAEIQLDNSTGYALVQAGLATEILPQQLKPASKNTGEAAFDSITSANRMLPNIMVRRAVSTGLSIQEERALDQRTEKYRQPATRGGEVITLGGLCGCLGVSARELFEMSDERLHHIATTVPPVPKAVDGSEWGAQPFRYAEFFQKGETWLGFLRRLRVSWLDLKSWERCQVENRAKASLHFGAPVKQHEMPKEEIEHLVDREVPQHRYV